MFLKKEEGQEKANKDQSNTQTAKVGSTTPSINIVKPKD
jgi:hypothetical protein